MHVQRYAALAVGICAMISMLSCLLLLGYIVFLSLKSSRKDRPNTWSFLKTQFGILFIHLILADLIQATGFAISFFWYKVDILQSHDNAVCTSQAVLIQFGDICSTLLTLVIALHTFFALVAHKIPKKVYVHLLWILVWIIAAILCLIGPVAIQGSSDLGNFYGHAGIWCWIKFEYEIYRLWLHYIFIFVTLCALVLIYPAVFCAIIRSERRKYTRSRLESRQTNTNWGGQNKVIRSMAIKMFIFPCAYGIVTMPIAISRAIILSRKHVGPKTLGIAGSLYTLSGFVNCITYSFSRNIVPIPKVRKVTEPRKVYKVVLENPQVTVDRAFLPHDEDIYKETSTVTSKYYFPNRIQTPPQSPPQSPDMSSVTQSPTSTNENAQQ